MESRMGVFDFLAGLTARLASTAPLADFVDAAMVELRALGFASVWVGIIDEASGELRTVAARLDGADITRDVPSPIMLDPRQPIGESFRERKLISIADPNALYMLERNDERVPAGIRAVSRATYERVNGLPFACGPLLGSDGAPVGGIGLSSYRVNQPIPNAVLAEGPVRGVLDLLAIGLERAHDAARIARLQATLDRTEQMITSDAPIKAVGKLASLAAHDINNLASIVQLAAENAARTPTPVDDELQRITKTSRLIGELVRSLQRTARRATSASSSAGASPSANLAQIVEDLAAIVKPLMRERTIAFHSALPALPAVRCDPVLVQQVVLNLVINAHDALASVPLERREIQIRARHDGGEVHLTVADTGPGIAPEVLARLFQPYFTTRKEGHLGLALAGSHAALALVGGRLVARNAATGGAVFVLSLPAIVEPVASAPEPAAVAVAPVRPAPRTARILAIDDDLDIVELIYACLAPLQHSVTTAVSSAEALEIAATETFDLVLCDVGMPRLSGVELASALRARGYRGKIVLMTGWEAPALATKDDPPLLLKKPFGGRELIAMIETALAR
jgi:signal transduction histidine kinase/CheY-like chemotaxis protein